MTQDVPTASAGPAKTSPVPQIGLIKTYENEILRPRLAHLAAMLRKRLRLRDDAFQKACASGQKPAAQMQRWSLVGRIQDKIGWLRRENARLAAEVGASSPAPRPGSMPVIDMSSDD